MENIVLIVVCIAAGVALRAARMLPENVPAALNGFVINISVPALALLYVHSTGINRDLLSVITMPWVFFLVGCCFLYPLARFLALDKATTGALLLCGGTLNTSFIGFPMIEAFYGREDIGIGLLEDQLGTTLIVSTIGIVVASAYAGTRVSVAVIVRRIVRFPPLWALILAFLLLPVSYPVWGSDILRRLGDTLVPVAMVAIGFQLQASHLAGNLRSLSLGLGYKLVLGPLLMVLIYAGLFRMSGRTFQIGIFETAMSPSIAAAIIAIDRGLNPPLVTLMVGVGIPLSLLTLTGWYYVLNSF